MHDVQTKISIIAHPIHSFTEEGVIMFRENSEFYHEFYHEMSNKCHDQKFQSMLITS